MKGIAKLKQLPPVYTGKWTTATEQEVEEEPAKGTPTLTHSVCQRKAL